MFVFLLFFNKIIARSHEHWADHLKDCFIALNRIQFFCFGVIFCPKSLSANSQHVNALQKKNKQLFETIIKNAV